MDCSEVHRVRGICFQFLAKPQDVVINSPCRRKLVMPPYLINISSNLVSWNHFARISAKIGAKPPLLWSQKDSFFPAFDIHRREVNNDISEHMVQFRGDTVRNAVGHRWRVYHYLTYVVKLPRSRRLARSNVRDARYPSRIRAKCESSFRKPTYDC